MTLTLMLYGLLVGAAFAVAALVLHSQERAANRSVRWIWMAMMAGTVVLTFAIGVRGASEPASIRTHVRGFDDSLLQSLPHRKASRAEVFMNRTRRALGAPSAAIALATSRVNRMLFLAPASTQRAIALSWGASSALCIALLLVVYRRVRRSAGAWHTARMLGTDVRVSQDAGPAVFGLRPMEIVVPSWILNRPHEEQRLVLRHEQEHIRAGDPVLLVCGCIAVALMPWNPLLWLGLSRLRLAVEIDCDRRVLRGGSARNSYARLLLDLSEHPSQLASSLPALSYSASHLERRLLAMTARPSRYLLPRRLAGGTFAGLLVLAACESRMPTSAEVESMDARRAVATARALPGVDSSRTHYTVDDLNVTRAEAERLAAEQIASIEVVKGKDRSSQIRLRTVVGRRDTVTLQSSRIRFTDSTLVGTEGTVSGNDLEPSRGNTFALMRGDSGVVRVRGFRKDSLASTPATRPRTMQLQRSKSGFDGIFIIDGRQVSDTVVNSINPNRIESVEVIKGPAAAALYSDQRALNGVILITTKRP